MQKILAEVHIADAIAENSASGDIQKQKQIAYDLYKTIYQNHQITDSLFMKSYHYYESNPALYDEMYNEVITQLSTLEAESKGKTEKK